MAYFLVFQGAAVQTIEHASQSLDFAAPVYVIQLAGTRSSLCMQLIMSIRGTGGGCGS